MLRMGMILGKRYEILERIGSGGMSDVYKANDYKLNRYVAVKVLKSEFNSDKNFVQKFRSEAQSAACLTHPNIVNVFDVGETEDLHYIVMELVEGITLKKYIEKKKRLQVKETIGIAVQVCQGIEAAHAQHIVHRDIKPQNIIISKEGKVKVTDFGIAKAASSQTISSNAMGSVHYISPEQARGGYCDERSDIYSMGITMYEMITGKVPFEGDSTVAIALQHIQGEMVSPRKLVPTIPVSLEKIILKCTQKKPELRYSSITSLMQDLKRALITPNEDFVRFVPASVSSVTRVMSQEDVNKIKRETSKIEGMKAAQEAYQRGEEIHNEEEDEKPAARRIRSSRNEMMKNRNTGKISTKGKTEQKNRSSRRSRYANLYEEDYDSFDDPEEEEGRSVFEKILMGIGIVVGVLILGLGGYLIATVAGLFESSSDPVVLQTDEQNTQEIVEVAMPNVVGKDIIDAEAELELRKLKYRLMPEDAGLEYKENEVIRQEIEAGTPVKQGTTVVLFFNTASSVATIPDNLIGSDYNSVRSQLTSLGLSVTREFEYSDSLSSGYVLRLTPASGSSVAKGSRVTVVVSRGAEVQWTEPPTQYAVVPNVVGYSISAAREMLEDVGLYCYPMEQESDTVPNGVVISQNYAGEYVEVGSTITVYVSSKPIPTTAAVTEPTEIVLPTEGEETESQTQQEPTEETEPHETEPIVTEPHETEPIVTEPHETEPLETEPLETEPHETESHETEPLETEPLETEPDETEPPTEPEEPVIETEEQIVLPTEIFLDQEEIGGEAEEEPVEEPVAEAVEEPVAVE